MTSSTLRAQLIATDNVISTFNTATELTKTHAIAFSTLLAKFTASCGGSCTNPLNSIQLVTISTDIAGATSLGSTTAGLGQFLKIGSAALEINFNNLLSSSAVDSRYAI